MRFARWFRSVTSRSGGRKRRCARRPCLERLEDRTLLSGNTIATATPLSFTSFNTAQVSGFLANPSQVDLYAVNLNASIALGDQIQASIAAQGAGSGLQSVLRVFDAAGNQVAEADPLGGDPSVSFQASVTGTYYIGVSSAGNDTYNPNSGLGAPGSSSGTYALNVSLMQNGELGTNVEGQEFRVDTPTATWGGTVAISGLIGNEGGFTAAAPIVNLLLSSDSSFSSSVVLQSFAESSLAPGASTALNIPPFSLPAVPPNGFPLTGPVYIGISVSNTIGDPGGRQLGIDFGQLEILSPVIAPGFNTSPGTAQPLLDLNSQVSGSLVTPSTTEWFTFTLRDGGNLTAGVDPTGLDPALTLYAANGTTVLFKSNNLSPSNTNALMALYLQPGKYFLAVSAQSGFGPYTLTTQFTPGTSPLNPAPLAGNPFAIATADLNGDGIPDVIVADGAGSPATASTRATPGTVGVLIGNGNGSFQAEQSFSSGGYSPFAVTTTDVNGDGRPDIIVVNRYASLTGPDHSYGTVGVLINNGDGTFTTHAYNVGGFPFAVATADLNGDGMPDIIVADHNDNAVTTLVNYGGLFLVEPKITASDHTTNPFLSSMTVADINGDGRPDIITSDYHYGTVSVLLNTTPAGGFATPPTFAAPETFAAGPSPAAITAADLNGDGKPDIAVANYTAGTVSVLLNQTTAGASTASFAAPQAFAAGNGPYAIVAADLNGDGKPDLAVTDFSTGTVSVLLNTSTAGTLSFAAPATFAAGRTPAGLAVADVNGDGQPDLIVADYLAGNVSVLLGNGDGSFLSQQGEQLVSVMPASFAGRPGLIAADAGGTITEYLQNSGGSFSSLPSFAVTGGLDSVQTADLNGDGIPDLVVADASGTVSVLLGNGDGSFSTEQTFNYGPGALVALGDLAGDGIEDIVIVDPSTGLAHVLLGTGEGTFTPVASTVNLGPGASSVTLADVNGDGKPDLIVANHYYSVVECALGNGNGTFGAVQFTPVIYGVSEVRVANINGDGIPDLITTNNRLGGAADLNGQRYAIADLLIGNGDGTFTDIGGISVGPAGTPIAVSDINGDGLSDLVTTNYNTGTITPILNTTVIGGTTISFSVLPSFSIGHLISSVAFADINGDGLPDLVIPAAYGSGVSVLLARGDGTFKDAATSVAQPINTPFQGDLNGDGTPDTVIRDGSGNIFVRIGKPGGGINPPVVLNNTNTGLNAANAQAALGAVTLPARDIALVQTPTGVEIAAADATQNAVTLYRVSTDAQGQVHVATSTFATPFPVTRIVAADLNGDGLPDLILADGVGDNIAVALQTAGGAFGTPFVLSAAVAPSDIAVVDENGDGRPDLVVSSATGGSVTVLLNTTPIGGTVPSFAAPQVFSATTGVHGTVTLAGAAFGTLPTVTSAVSSLDQLGSVAVGDFSGTGRNDLAVVNRASHAIDLLSADGSGGFVNPQVGVSLGTGGAVPLSVVSGDFNRDGIPDLAVLVEQPNLSVVDENRNQVLIFTGNGNGTFTLKSSVAVGSFATGLSVVPDSGTGLLDILVGDQFGNVLRLIGAGDGTFQVAGNNVALAPLNGQTAVVVANQQANHVTVQVPTGVGQFSATQQINLPAGTAPNQVQFFPLNQNSTSPSMVLVGDGSNNIVVGQLSTGGFTSANYFAGSNPSNVTVAQLRGPNAPPDMIVADQGSNQVSILFGNYDANGNWFATPGPRLETGGFGPIAVSVQDVTGPQGTGGPDGIPDLVITNAQSGTMTVLPGIGNGYFNDQASAIKVIPIGVPVVQAPVPIGPSGQAVGVAADGELFTVNLADPSAGVQFVSAPPEIAAVTPMNGELVAALQNGNVDVLQFDPTLGVFAPTLELSPLSGALPPSPTDITILPTPGGGFEALVSTAGSDQLFVFGLESPGASGSPPSLSEQSQAGSAPQTVAAPPPEEPLVLIVTLQAPTLSEEGGTSEVVQSEGAAAELAAAGSGEGNENADVEVVAELEAPGAQTDGPVNEEELNSDVPDAAPDMRIVLQPAAPQALDTDLGQLSLAALWQGEADPWQLDVKPAEIEILAEAEQLPVPEAEPFAAVTADAGQADSEPVLSPDDAAVWWAAADEQAGDEAAEPPPEVVASQVSESPADPASEQTSIAVPVLEPRCEPEQLIGPALTVAGLTALPLAHLEPKKRAKRLLMQGPGERPA
jgi:hypothetical protein